MLLLLLCIENCFDLSSVFTMPPFSSLPQNTPGLFSSHLITQKTLKSSEDSHYENQPVTELSCKQKTQVDQFKDVLHPWHKTIPLGDCMQAGAKLFVVTTMYCCYIV